MVAYVVLSPHICLPLVRCLSKAAFLLRARQAVDERIGHRQCLVVITRTQVCPSEPSDAASVLEIQSGEPKG